jgi:hypothetical protein
LSGLELCFRVPLIGWKAPSDEPDLTLMLVASACPACRSAGLTVPLSAFFIPEKAPQASFLSFLLFSEGSRH